MQLAACPSEDHLYPFFRRPRETNPVRGDVGRDPITSPLSKSQENAPLSPGPLCPFLFIAPAPLPVYHLPRIKVSHPLLYLLRWGGSFHSRLSSVFAACWLFLFLPFLPSPLTSVAAVVLWKSWKSTNKDRKLGIGVWEAQSPQQWLQSVFACVGSRRDMHPHTAHHH